MVVVEVAVGLGIARDIHPGGGHALPVTRRGQQAIDQPLVGVRALVGDEGVDLGEGRRQAGQVERHPVDQGLAVGLRRGPQPLLLQLGVNVAVEVVDRLTVERSAPDRNAPGRDVGPVRLVFGALLDPAGEDGDLGRGQGLVRRLGRHLQLVVGRQQAADQLALLRMAGDHRATAPVLRNRGVGVGGDVEPQARLALAHVVAVATEAVVRKDRPHVPGVVDLLRNAPGGRGHGRRRLIAAGAGGEAKHGERRSEGGPKIAIPANRPAHAHPPPNTRAAWSRLIRPSGSHSSRRRSIHVALTT